MLRLSNLPQLSLCQARLLRYTNLLMRRKAVNGFRDVGLTGFQYRGWEACLVRRVWIVLGFQRQSIALPVHMVANPHECSSEEIASVELESRLGGPSLEDTTGARVSQNGGKR